jgi:hypothetical protein
MRVRRSETGRPASRPGARGADAGSVTAETAVLLPGLVVLLVLLLWAISAVAGQLRCIDAARVAARAAARGDGSASAVSLARRAAPPGAVVSVTSSGESVVVTVRARIRALPSGGAAVPAVSVAATATAPWEPE